MVLATKHVTVIYPIACALFMEDNVKITRTLEQERAGPRPICCRLLWKRFPVDFGLMVFRIPRAEACLALLELKSTIIA